MKHEMPKAYVSFKKDATDVLEQMLDFTLNQGNAELVKALHKAEEVIARIAVLGASAADIEHRLIQVWAPEIQESVRLAKRLSRASYVLAKASENEALARVLPGVRRAVMTKHEVDAVLQKHNALGPMAERIHLAYERLASHIAHAARMGKIMNDEPRELIRRIRRYYPEKRLVKRTPRPLADPKLREAAGDMNLKRDAIDQDWYDEDEWNALTDLYQDMNLDEGRFGQQKYDGVDRYRFEFEQEATEDFVDKVRAGEISAANDQGIDDFVWTAVLDKKTCENCCEKRDGLLTSDIRSKLKGPWKADACQAVVAPAHPNCRCRMLPVASNLIPETKVSYTGIDEWLNSRAA